LEEHVGNLGFIRMVEEVRRALALLAHAHVGRAVSLEGEAAIRLIKLHGGDADIEDDAVHLLDTARGKRLTHPGKSFRHKRQAPPARSSQRLAALDRVGIAIKSEDAGHSLRKDGLGVTARPEGAVDMRLAGNRGERVDDLFEEDGEVARGGGLRGSAHAFPPRCRR